jgi:hypothetical protein
LEQLASNVYYSKLDIIAAFNKLHIAPGHKYLTAINTQYRQYESLVMPVGLCNGPSSFKHYINDTPFQFLDWFCAAYSNEILIYSNTLAEHRQHVDQVL